MGTAAISIAWYNQQQLCAPQSCGLSYSHTQSFTFPAAAVTGPPLQGTSIDETNPFSLAVLASNGGRQLYITSAILSQTDQGSYVVFQFWNITSSGNKFSGVGTLTGSTGTAQGVNSWSDTTCGLQLLSGFDVVSPWESGVVPNGWQGPPVQAPSFNAGVANGQTTITFQSWIGPVCENDYQVPGPPPEEWYAQGEGYVTATITFPGDIRPPYAQVSAPTVATASASAVGLHTAQLNGQLNPNGAVTTGYFQYGTTGAYGTSTPSFSTTAGNTSMPVNATITGLTPGTTYHYRLVGSNSTGVSYGTDQTFTTTTTTTSTTTTTTPGTTTSTTTTTTPGTTPSTPGRPSESLLSCLVPNLHGMTLGQARSVLNRAHCRLGKVHQPKRVVRHHVLRVAGQSARVRTEHARNYRVNITLK